MTEAEQQRMAWFINALMVHKKLALGNDSFFLQGDFYLWQNPDGWKLQVVDPEWLYPIFVETCNSYGMSVDDYFFMELLGLPLCLNN